MVRRLALLLMLSSVTTAQGDDLSSAPTLIPTDEQPDLPAPIQSGQPMEPDITIIRRGEETIEEHRMNNQVYRIKVNPSIGPSYTLEDLNGDGNMDVRRSDLQNQMNIRQWTLFSW